MIAKAFITSKLSLLLMLSFLLLGVFSIAYIPREEEPQIEVPMADIMVGYPGASPQEVEAHVVQPLEKAVANIRGVEDVYATAMDGPSLSLASCPCDAGECGLRSGGLRWSRTRTGQ